MAKKAKVKCPQCGEMMNREGKIPVKSRFYHPECLEDLRKQNAEGTKSVNLSSNENEYAELISYICERYDIPRPTGMILKQIKTYKEDFGYRYKGMELALRFFYDLEENHVRDDAGVGIIPYVYDRAKNFYARRIELQNSLTDEEPEVRVFKSRGRSVGNKRQIDMNEL